MSRRHRDPSRSFVWWNSLRRTSESCDMLRAHVAPPERGLILEVAASGHFCSLGFHGQVTSTEIRPDSQGMAGLALGFCARGFASIALSVYLLTHQLSWTGLFRAGAGYALLDGVIGLAVLLSLTGTLRSWTSPVLIALTFCDALFRILFGVAVLWYPALAQVPMMIVPLLGSIGVTAGALGLAALVVWLVEHHRRRHTHVRGAEVLFDPIPIIALLSIGVGTMLIVDPPTSAEELWRVIATGGVVLGASFFVAAAGALMFRPRAP